MSKKVIQVQTIGFGGLLTILFIALKLTNFIDWSWVWVLAPLWVPVAFILAFALSSLVVLALFMGAITIYDKIKSKKK